MEATDPYTPPASELEVYVDPQVVWRNGDLIDDGGILERYYQRGTLASDRARRHFVLPDRLADR